MTNRLRKEIMERGWAVTNTYIYIHCSRCYPLFTRHWIERAESLFNPYAEVLEEWTTEGEDEQ